MAKEGVHQAKLPQNIPLLSICISVITIVINITHYTASAGQQEAKNLQGKVDN